MYIMSSQQILKYCRSEEEGKKEVLSAVGAAIKKAISATPVFTVDPVKELPVQDMEPMNMRRSRWQPSAAWQKAQRSIIT